MTDGRPSQIIFCGAAHLDRIGILGSPAVMGASNPGLFVDHPGGAALNTASVFRNLLDAKVADVKVRLVTILGEDEPGERIRAACETRGFEISAQRQGRTATYTAILQPDDADMVDAFDDLPDLQRLDLAGNQIVKFENGAFEGLRNE